MKKIINNKMYNTETAKLLGNYQNGYGRGDFHYKNEELYQKRTQEYFLFVEGGPLSEWGEPYGGNYCYGSRIIPLAYEEARKWAVDNLDVDLFCELFGEPEE